MHRTWKGLSIESVSLPGNVLEVVSGGDVQLKAFDSATAGGKAEQTFVIKPNAEMFNIKLSLFVVVNGADVKAQSSSTGTFWELGKQHVLHSFESQFNP